MSRPSIYAPELTASQVRGVRKMKETVEPTRAVRSLLKTPEKASRTATRMMPAEMGTVGGFC